MQMIYVWLYSCKSGMNNKYKAKIIALTK